MLYSEQLLLTRLQQIGGKTKEGFYTIIGVQSVKDQFNKFDDMFYLFDGNKVILTTTGTTNAGKNALLNFKDVGLDGAAVWKTDQYYEDLYVNGLHKGKMEALRQSKPIYYYRDNDKDELAEEQGVLHHGIIFANFHGVDYNIKSEKVSTEINGWSYACQVCNRMKDYNQIITLTKERNKPVSYALLKEFEV